MQKLSIGEMARINGISSQALRLYSKMGLIEPAYINEETGYRYYDIRQSVCLDMIRYMKSLGISLKEIQVLLNRTDIEAIQKILDLHKAEIDLQINRLKANVRGIDLLKTRLDLYGSVSQYGKIMTEEIPRRMIHCFAARDLNYEDELGNSADFEMILRDVQKIIQDSSLPISYFSNVCSTVDKDDFAEGLHKLKGIFILADDYSKGFLPVEYLAGGTYLCIYFEGFAREKNYRRKLLKEIERRGYAIAGDFVCETIAEYPVFKAAERNTIIKIQIPVEISAK